MEDAQEFLDLQFDRITHVEEDLLEATEDILPIESHCMTVTELVQLCTSLQRANVELMRLLDNKLRSEYGCESALSEEQWSACKVEEGAPSPVEEAAPWQNLVRTSLDQVVETDNETDATTTPGSSSFFSPPLSAFSTRERTTPATPTLDNLHLRYVNICHV